MPVPVEKNQMRLAGVEGIMHQCTDRFGPQDHLIAWFDVLQLAG
jgi:hypothetical protein